jgi:DNA-binding SARP family transcriptional activator
MADPDPRYRILGPLTVRAERRLPSAPKVQLVLAMLLIHADTPLSVDRLMDELWGDRSPRRAAAALQVYVSQLRKFLREPGKDVPIRTRAPGYVLEVEPGDLDLRVFTDLLKRGRSLMREADLAGAAQAAESALQLWGGTPLVGLSGTPGIDAFTTWAEERRLECVELWAEAYLGLGRAHEVVGPLSGLVAEYPLREVFYRQLMTALVRVERQADALAVYQNARTALAAELGLAPCRALHRLFLEILDDDERLYHRAVA